MLENALSKAQFYAAREMREDAKNCGLHHFGHSALTLYYCDNYMSPVHRDADSGFSLALQISKEGCHEGDYDFGYVEYGIRFCTIPGSAW